MPFSTFYIPNSSFRSWFRHGLRRARVGIRGAAAAFVASDLVRLAWARSEMQKAADAAAEAGALMADIAAWKNAGVVQLLPGAPAEAANVAAMNLAGLTAKNIHPSITYIVVDEGANTVRVGMRAQVKVTLLSVLFPQLSVSTEGTSQLRLGNLR